MTSLMQANEARSAKRHKTESLKDTFNAAQAWERVLGYSKNGYASINDDDKDFILKSFGLFDRPATPERFMLRVRIAGGALSVEQAMAVAHVAKTFGQDYIDLTTRQQIELRYLRIEDIPELYKQLEDVGLTGYQTGVDNFRNILIDPLDGLAMDNIISCRSILEGIQSIFLKNPDWITTLPRKFNIGINGSLSNRCNIFGQDFALSLAQKDGIYGFNLYLGGRVGSLAHNADMFVLPDEAVKVFEAVATLFKTYGFRDNRNKNRLKFLIEAVGMDEFRKAIEEQLGHTMPTAGESLSALEGGDHYGKIALKDGSFALYSAVPSGVFSGTDLRHAAEIAQTQNGSIRLTIEQNLIITGIRDEESALQSPLFVKYPNRPSPYMANLIACAGSEHCPFGVIPGKPDAITMSEYLSHTVPMEDAKIRLYWSACVKGCGVHGAGDLGFVGCKVAKGGKTVLGVDIFIGGTLSGEGGEGHLLLKGVVLDEAKEYVAEFMREYRDLKMQKESLEYFIRRLQSRYSNYAIGFLMRWNRHMEQNSLEAQLHFNLKTHGGNHKESDEIYGFGLALVHSITKIKAYDVEDPFVEGKKPYHFDTKSMDILYRPYKEIIEKMVHPNPMLRYQVFTEIVNDIEKTLHESE
ncbi:ferredoxin--nitrite reductase [Sulfuricurvum sp.]|uniref:nitrite/sulfite reductase n=1 Tax=Sulfuricurvum sp. TaxID=2025608 RepID=UPI002603CB48|nr:ferredoxin--nitrite reductase [Sulfuricurvum sp.]MDD2267882.1 ferredoxin--nitrite reductase [Sulfuricurvum sp.]MDD2784922.1 ferredoxin--nitrite reductase [Sulfuricurvum sp.]